MLKASETLLGEHGPQASKPDRQGTEKDPATCSRVTASPHLCPSRRLQAALRGTLRTPADTAQTPVPSGWAAVTGEAVRQVLL